MRRGSGRGSGRCLDFWVEPAEGEECLRGGDEGDVVVPAAPGSAFEVVEPEAVFELAVVVFDPPAHLRPPHQVSDRRVRRQVRYPVVRRGVLAVRPFDQEGLGGQDAVPLAAAPARLLSCGQRLFARGPHRQHRES